VEPAISGRNRIRGVASITRHPRQGCVGLPNSVGESELEAAANLRKPHRELRLVRLRIILSRAHPFKMASLN
jgi:hypothetical protein